MKMKSKIFGLGAKLALCCVAVLGTMTSCYEKEDLEVVTPDEVAAAEYYIGGVVTDATTGSAVSGATVTITGTGSVSNSSITTSNDGSFNTKVSTYGQYAVTVSCSNYYGYATSVAISKIADGEVAYYPVNIALNPTVTEEETKYNVTPDYKIQVYVADADGPVKDATVNIGVDKGTTDDAGIVKFETGITPGTYQAVITAEGYNQASASINVAQVTLTSTSTVEGTTEEVWTTASVIMSKTPEEEVEEEVADYYFFVKVQNAEGEALTGASVSITVDGKAYTTSSNEVVEAGYGYYTLTLKDHDIIAPTSLVTVTAMKSGYQAGTTAQIIYYVGKGETSNNNLTVTMVVPSDETAETGGSASYSFAEEDYSTASAIEGEAKNDLLAAAAAAGYTVDDNTVVAVVENGFSMTATSTVAELNADGSTSTSTVVVPDVISLDANTVIAFTGDAGPISVSRNAISEESESVAARIYEGTPDGAVFSNPLTITMPATTDEVESGDFDMNTMYYNATSGAWEVEADNYAEVSETGSNIVGKISHFSKFMFGFESSIATSDTIATSEVISYSAYTADVARIVTVKGTYDGGSAFNGNTPALSVAAQLPSFKSANQSYIKNLLLKLVKANNGNIVPANDYDAVSYSQDIEIPANTQISGFTLTKYEIQTTFTIQVVLAGSHTVVAVPVTMKKIVNYKLAYNKEAGHSHGHGDDLNAGGGIITFE